MAPLLQLEEVSCFYGRVQALHRVSLGVEEGQVVTILGANGAGKTSTLRAISGLLPPAAGRIQLGGQPLVGRSPEQIVRAGVAHVPEGREVFAELTVHENLRLGAYTRRDGRVRVAQDMQRVLSYFPVLEDRTRQIAGTLSGGEQQMLAIGRALMIQPRLLLLDEPSLGLAPLLVREIFRIIRAVNQDEHVTVVLVEQNANMALLAADYAYVLETGRVSLGGPAAELRQNDAVRKSYLGRAVGSPAE